ncbi:hypothetical protein ACA910_008150 [Epithemia clementina (nom. ined.)]
MPAKRKQSSIPLLLVLFASIALPLIATLIISIKLNEDLQHRSSSQPPATIKTGTGQQQLDSSSWKVVDGERSSTTTNRWGLDEQNPLAIPYGQPPNLPSIRVQGQKHDSKRHSYGGRGDKAHLGGFTTFDIGGISPTVWRNMLTEYGIKSIMDVGCGRGISTLWFYLHGVNVLCVEGSHDAVENSVLQPPHVDVAVAVEAVAPPLIKNNQTQPPPPLIVEHDYARGPWWPAKTYDAVWSVEFLEHVGLNYHFNYMSTFRKAALIFVTSSQQGGWHHVEVHSDDWWIRKFTAYGFVYDANLTLQVKQWVHDEQFRPLRNNAKQGNDTTTTYDSYDYAPNGKRFNPFHIGASIKVFINPVVAALPQHAHLFMEHGCLDKRENGKVLLRPCQAKQHESELPESYLPLTIDPQSHVKWDQIMKQYI